MYSNSRDDFIRPGLARVCWFSWILPVLSRPSHYIEGLSDLAKDKGGKNV
jgi:hypothetical protein